MMSTVTRPPDAETFDEYASRSWSALYRAAYLLTANHADAEDLAQHTLLKAYRSWSKVSSAASPEAYVRRMLTNTFLSQRRPRRRTLELLTETPPEPHGTGSEGPEERLRLWPHLAALPPRQRAVVVLRYYEDLSEQDIAAALNCTPGTVKSTAHHALKSLRAALGSVESTGMGS